MGFVSPKFHVGFGDNFETVPHLRSGTVPDNWSHLVQNKKQQPFDGFYDVTKTWFEGTEDPSCSQQTDSLVSVPNQSQTQTTGHSQAF